MKGISAAYGFLGGFLGGVVIGYLVDRFLGTTPWGIVGGTVFGFFQGLYSLYRNLQQ